MWFLTFKKNEKKIDRDDSPKLKGFVSIKHNKVECKIKMEATATYDSI